MDVSPRKCASILTLRENTEKTIPGDIKDCWCQYIYNKSYYEELT